MLTKKQIIHRYFDLIQKKDLRGILDLFTEKDPVVHEPFSNEKGGLKGKDAITSFLEVSMMANDGLRNTINLVGDNSANGNETVIAIVNFERGGNVQGRFTFAFVKEMAAATSIHAMNAGRRSRGSGSGSSGSNSDDSHVEKIKSLKIRFS